MAKYRISVEETASWQKPVLSISDAGTATEGNRYIVGEDPTGTFEGLTPHDIAWYDGTEWQTDTPTEGWRVYNLDTSQFLVFGGTTWASPGEVGDKMDKQALATEDNLVAFDDEGNSKDSGVKTPQYSAALGNIVMEFDT